MTREEIIERLRTMKAALIFAADATPESQEMVAWASEAINGAISALKGPTREQVEKMRGEWTTDGVCSRCGFDAMYYKGVPVQVRTNYCPACGAPLTDKAVDMVMERLEVLKDGKGN